MRPYAWLETCGALRFPLWHVDEVSGRGVHPVASGYWLEAAAGQWPLYGHPDPDSSVRGGQSTNRKHPSQIARSGECGAKQGLRPFGFTYSGAIAEALNRRPFWQRTALHSTMSTSGAADRTLLFRAAAGGASFIATTAASTGADGAVRQTMSREQ